MSKGIRDFFVYGIIVAGILVVVRPGSQAAGFVRAIGQATTGFVQAITGRSVTTKGVKG
jgi:hypothetical protein